MFGLGVGELVLLIGVIALIGGPAAVMKVARLYQSAQRAKSELTGKAILGKILDPDNPSHKRKKKTRKKKRKAAG